ncbi:MAG: hypothetical protein ND866_28130 [Pyrinomonadaceae bacterium]|nr:hypothetical protein [Pyrinomonadaceae bacterium]
MRQHPAHSAAKLFTGLVFVLVALDGSTTVSAQGGRRRDLDRREEQLNSLERETTRKRDPKEILLEVNEDLSRLNVINEDLSAKATAGNQPLNYKDIVGNVTEIKKRATRLKSSLALPQEQNEEKSAGFKDAEKAELQPVLTALNKLLDGFLRNPIFSDSGPLDMRLAAQARRDLEDIIVLSEKLRKNAENRSKSTDKAP